VRGISPAGSEAIGAVIESVNGRVDDIEATPGQVRSLVGEVTPASHRVTTSTEGSRTRE
jgi:hypothetical protein